MKISILITSFVFFTSVAWGAGYQLRYQGAESMGTSFASQGSYGTSLSSIYYNPALFLKQGKKQAVSLEGMVIYPTKAEFTADSGQNYDDFTDPTFTGSLYYGYMIDDTTALTVAVTTPWATSSDYPDDWVGALAAIKTDLKTVNVQPVISKMIGEKFAFSVGPQIQWLQGTLSSANNVNPTPPPLVNAKTELDGDNINVGAILAFTYMPSEQLTFNLSYTSQIRHNIRGSITSEAPLLDDDSVNAELYTPDIISLGSSYVFSDAWIGHFSASYTNWSLFDSLDIEDVSIDPTPGAPAVTSSTVQNWKDTYFLAAGATFIASETMTFRGGLSYETSAVDNEDRTPRTQDSDRLSLGLGASFKLAGNLNLDLGFNHIFYLGDIELNTADEYAPFGPLVNYDGEYDTSASLLRAGLEYTF